MPVPNTFANATTTIPLSQLDNNFATAITLGNTAIQLGNTVTTLNNMTMANVTISSVSTPITPAQGGTGLTTLTANNVLLGNGTSNVTFVAPGTSGNVLTSNGTVWSSQAPAAAGSFPAGTAMMFVQTAAPTGWTKSTTHDNKALRVVSGAASSGGSVAFTTAFASQTPAGTVGSTTLTTTQIPSHTHTYDKSSGSGPGGSCSSTPTGFTSTASGATGGGGSHNHTFTGTAINLAVQYVDVIIATKD